MLQHYIADGYSSRFVHKFGKCYIKMHSLDDLCSWVNNLRAMFDREGRNVFSKEENMSFHLDESCNENNPSTL